MRLQPDLVADCEPVTVTLVYCSAWLTCCRRSLSVDFVTLSQEDGVPVSLYQVTWVGLVYSNDDIPCASKAHTYYKLAYRNEARSVL